MPEAFTEAFVAVLFFHGSYRGSFHGVFVLELLQKKTIVYYCKFAVYSHGSVREGFHESFRESFRGGKFIPRKLP